MVNIDTKILRLEEILSMAKEERLEMEKMRTRILTGTLADHSTEVDRENLLAVLEPKFRENSEEINSLTQRLTELIRQKQHV